MGFLLLGSLCGYLIDVNTIYVIEGEPTININYMYLYSATPWPHGHRRWHNSNKSINK